MTAMQAQIVLPSEFDADLKETIRQIVIEVMQETKQQPQTSKTEFFNLGQAADFIHVSRGTLNKLIKQGDIKVTFVESAKRISRKQLTDYMDSKAI